MLCNAPSWLGHCVVLGYHRCSLGEGMTRETRILIADNDPLARIGICAILAPEQDLICVGEATNADEILSMCEELTPDLLLLDLQIPDISPIESVPQLLNKHHELQVIAISAFRNDIYTRNLIASGISGLIVKDEIPETLIKVIRMVIQGETWIGHNVSSQACRNEEIHFTKREMDVIHLLATGLSNRVIAGVLCVSEHAVRFHLRNIYEKTGVHSRGELIVWAIEKRSESNESVIHS